MELFWRIWPPGVKSAVFELVDDRFFSFFKGWLIYVSRFCCTKKAWGSSACVGNWKRGTICPPSFDVLTLQVWTPTQSLNTIGSRYPAMARMMLHSPLILLLSSVSEKTFASFYFLMVSASHSSAFWSVVRSTPSIVDAVCWVRWTDECKRVVKNLLLLANRVKLRISCYRSS